MTCDGRSAHAVQSPPVVQHVSESSTILSPWMTALLDRIFLSSAQLLLNPSFPSPSAICPSEAGPILEA
eukprot:765898-Hanusia_phi.AAC.6